MTVIELIINKYRHTVLVPNRKVQLSTVYSRQETFKTLEILCTVILLSIELNKRWSTKIQVHVQELRSAYKLKGTIVTYTVVISRQEKASPKIRLSFLISTECKKHDTKLSKTHKLYNVYTVINEWQYRRENIPLCVWRTKWTNKRASMQVMWLLRRKPERV